MKFLLLFNNYSINQSINQSSTVSASTSIIASRASMYSSSSAFKIPPRPKTKFVMNAPAPITRANLRKAGIRKRLRVDPATIPAAARVFVPNAAANRSNIPVTAAIATTKNGRPKTAVPKRGPAMKTNATTPVRGRAKFRTVWPLSLLPPPSPPPPPPPPKFGPLLILLSII